MLRRYSPLVEKMGMDEAFLDVTVAVDRELLLPENDDENGAAAASTRGAAHHRHHYDHQDDHDDDEEEEETPVPFIGHLYQGRASGRGQRLCRCGCRRRLALGSRLADAMRRTLKAEVGYEWGCSLGMDVAIWLYMLQ